MSKSGVILSFVFCLIVLTGFVFAANETVFNGSNIDKAFSCLSTQVDDDCSGAKKVQEIALTILASPSGITQACYNRLMSSDFKRNDCFGDSSCNAKDTALAILALNHVGQNTKEYEDWLKNHTRIAEDLIWYLEQDSVGKAGCKISYNSNEHTFNVLENKKIDSNAGNCLTLAQSNYWFQVAPSCYGTKFTLVCDVNYIATFLYKQPTASTLYVLSDTKSAQASQPLELTVNSLCFGESSCNYEASAWAAIALDKTSNDIQDYLPYLIAGEDANRQYLPVAFLNIIKDYSEYGTKLIQLQRLNSWEAENTAYNKYYDTGLALLALSSSNQQKVVDAKNWLLNIAQDTDGCWNNDNIRDTAMILWAIEGRRGSVSGATSLLTDCGDAGFFCISTDRCPEDELLPNYNCATLGKKCCKNENLESCTVQGGIRCASDKICSGDVRRASDTEDCCLADCVDPETRTDCDIAGGFCKTSCSSTQTESSLSCDGDGVCCMPGTPQKSSSSWWVWVLIILIFILAVISYIYRDKLKVWWFKIRSGFRKDKGDNAPKSGFPPTGFSGEKRVFPQTIPPRPMQGGVPIRRPLPPMSRPPLRR